jgi:hypothetical protein
MRSEGPNFYLLAEPKLLIRRLRAFYATHRPFPGTAPIPCDHRRADRPAPYRQAPSGADPEGRQPIASLDRAPAVEAY